MTRAIGRRAACTLCLLAFVGALRCAHTPLPADNTSPGPVSVKEVVATWRGRSMALRHSHFYGEMYDDNERMLMSPYSFSSLYHRVDLKGRPIGPGPSQGIVPAGSSVVIESVELPGPLAYLRRMLNGPTAHVWVRLRLMPEQAAEVHGGGAQPRPLIVVLEPQISSGAQLNAAMEELFGEVEQTKAWLEGLRPRVRAAIKDKRLLRGMQLGEMVAAQGSPWHWLDDATAQGAPSKVAWYPKQEAWLVNDVVVDIRPARTRP